MQPIIYTKDLDSLFFPKLDDIAEKLWCDPMDLARVMKSESDMRSTAWNDNPKDLPPEKRYNASGLIQFMPNTLIGLGYKLGHAAFRAMGATVMLDYVYKYYLPWKGKLKSVGALYTATFLPAFVDKANDKSFILTAKEGPLGWAYAPNSSFDANHDYAITVGELEEAVERNCVGARWNEIVARMTNGDISPNVVLPEIDLRTVLGIQKGLIALGYTPGEADGFPGPRTTNALVAFQRDQGLTADGIFGPNTRVKMEALLPK